MHADDEFARWFPDDYTVGVKEKGARIAPRRNLVIADETRSRPRGSNPEPVVYKTTALPLS
jgi:hypothetical protein